MPYKFSSTLYLLGVSKPYSHPLWEVLKLLQHVSGSSLGMIPRPFAVAHFLAFELNQQTLMKHYKKYDIKY